MCGLFDQQLTRDKLQQPGLVCAFGHKFFDSEISWKCEQCPNWVTSQWPQLQFQQNRLRLLLYFILISTLLSVFFSVLTGPFCYTVALNVTISSSYSPVKRLFGEFFFYLKRPCGVRSWFPVGGIWLWSASLGPSSSSLTLTTPVTPTYTHVQALLSQYQRSGEIQLQPDVCICARCVSV